MASLPLRSFRLVCKEREIPPVEDLLRGQGFAFEREPFYTLARRLAREPLPLGSSLAAVFGCLYIQDRASMLPPLVLAPPPGAAVLDLCAAPGGKTGLLAQLAGFSGFVLGNEPAKPRLATLRRNLQSLGLLCCATSSFPGERMPLPGGIWERILLDPPCSGWGTAEKHPRVLSLWRGDKIVPLARLQRRLLAEAGRLLRPGGLLVYSTCTTNQEENEDQVAWARRETGLEILPLDPPSGFSLLPPAHAEAEGCLRIPPGEYGQGFFVALLRKPAASAAPPCPPPSPAGGAGAGLPAEADVPWTDLRALSGGSVEVRDGASFFLPDAGRAILPPSFVWTGFPLGRSRGRRRPHPALRTLMPDRETARRRGLPCLDLEETEPLAALLSGRNFPVDCAGREMGLYFRDLPLCLLTVRGRRAMLPALPGKST
ncbi:MAG: RsmB/NOP family class I SAM-dependent RNA methyltransferase [Desulfovibrio sp.]|nr:RsmB/NOP family class I SAM-dependent RNA methyltransferase [Desulfovibrio sp.]